MYITCYTQYSCIGDCVVFSPGKVSTPVSAAAAPAVSELSDFSSCEVLGWVCRSLLEHTQLQTHTLQAQPVGEEVSVTLKWSEPGHISLLLAA